MKIILKEDIENLGRKGDIVNVASGYGRNYLIPQKKAIQVTRSNLKMIEIEQQALKKKIEQERLSFQDLINSLNATTLTFKRKAGDKDVIFGSVSVTDIREELDKKGLEIEKKKIVLEEPIKRLGNYTVPVKVYHDDRAEIKVEVVREEEAAAVKEKPIPEVKESPSKPDVLEEEEGPEVKEEEIPAALPPAEEKGELVETKPEAEPEEKPEEPPVKEKAKEKEAVGEESEGDKEEAEEEKEDKTNNINQPETGDTSGEEEKDKQEEDKNPD
ncbi:MAG: 50S ribosomal protein L9 [Candidatus Aminicenantes bacterium]|nr:50S ribosomal protein L9 [Candidatus Aminicenantes bacterium]